MAKIQKGSGNDRNERVQIRFERSWKAFNRGDVAVFLKSTATELCRDLDESVGGPFAKLIGPAPDADANSDPAPTVSVGDSAEQVSEAFGRPSKIIKNEDAVVYLYKDVRVTFDAGGAYVVGVEVR